MKHLINRRRFIQYSAVTASVLTADPPIVMNIPSSSSVVLVMAHPDDIKMVTGMAMRAMEQKSRVFLVQVTKGEGLSRSQERKTDPREMGERRMAELIDFLKIIGIPRDNLFLMGVPNSGETLPALREDFFKSEEGAPFYDIFLRTDRAPYQDAFQPDMPLYGEVFLAALESILIKLQPHLLLTHHPKDFHIEHRAISFFVRKAVSRLNRSETLKSAPPVYASLGYYRQGWPPDGDYYHTKETKELFPHLEICQFSLTDKEFEAKKKACMTFTPTLSAKYIQSHMKKDEVVWRL